MNLIEMEPRGDLTSTGFALANPGNEYLVLQPKEGADPFTLTLEPGTYSVEWFAVDNRESKSTGKLKIKISGDTSFTPAFSESGPAVLYLKNVES